jgi:dynein heavy chain
MEPILNKTLKKIAGRTLLVLGADKEIKYDENFRFYLTTKMANPKYKAEISTRSTVVNFTVKEEGLEE